MRQRQLSHRGQRIKGKVIHMDKIKEILNQVEKFRIIPVIKLDHADEAVPVVRALCEGGLPVAEITFRTDAAEESIRLAVEALPEAVIGAGTVVNVQQAQRAKAAGAKFIVSPGFSPKVTEWAVENGMPLFPGCCTPTEIMAAMEFGIPVVKFFPAAQYGGVGTIKSLAAPFPGIRFIPTGGINTDNLTEYLNYDRIIACGGSWMAEDRLIRNGMFDEIRKRTEEAVSCAKSCRVA